jgi:hypothetical protein
MSAVIPRADKRGHDWIVRYVPIASLRSAEKQWVFAPLDHLEVSDRLADQGVSF